MKIEELREIAGVKIGGAVGYASLCWIPKPTGVFDTNEAQKFCDELMKYVDTLLDVVEAVIAHLPYTASGDLFGAGKYSEHNVSAHKLREALKKLEEI